MSVQYGCGNRGPDAPKLTPHFALTPVRQASPGDPHPGFRASERPLIAPPRAPGDSPWAKSPRGGRTSANRSIRHGRKRDADISIFRQSVARNRARRACGAIWRGCSSAAKHSLCRGIASRAPLPLLLLLEDDPDDLRNVAHPAQQPGFTGFKPSRFAGDARCYPEKAMCASVPLQTLL